MGEIQNEKRKQDKFVGGDDEAEAILKTLGTESKEEAKETQPPDANGRPTPKR